MKVIYIYCKSKQDILNNHKLLHYFSIEILIKINILKKSGLKCSVIFQST